MNLKKNTRLLSVLAMLSVLFLLVTMGIMQGSDPKERKCSEIFPSFSCINGGCTAQNYRTEWCRIWGCDMDPGYVECYPK
jgi:hypothetical protein